MERSSLLRTIGGHIVGRRGRWVVILLWIVAVGLLNSLLPGVNKQVINNAPNLPSDAPSVVADTLVQREFPSAEGVPALVVWQRDGGLKDEDYEAVRKSVQSLASSPVPAQKSVPPFDRMAAAALKQQASKDGETFVLPVLFAPGTDTEVLKEATQQLQERIDAAVGGSPFDTGVSEAGALRTRITGPVGIQVDATALFKNADFALLMGTVLLVLVLLLLIYRSPILALIPLVGVGFAYGAVSPILGAMAKAGVITVDSQAISIMTVLLFGAGTDYCLFIITRYRQLLTEQADKGAALRLAVLESTGAVAMSGFTVVISLLVLLLAHYGSIYRFAVPFSLSILIMGLASVTLIPALLAVLGRASFYPFVPRTAEMAAERASKRGKPVPAPRKSGRFGWRIADFIVRRPRLVAGASLLVLLALAAMALQIRTTFNLLSSFPDDMPSREGYAMLQKSFPPGELAPVSLIVDTEGKAVDIPGALRKQPEIEQVAEPQQGRMNPHIQSFEFRLNLDPYSPEAMDTLPKLRSVAEAALKQAGITSPGGKVWIAGQTTEQADTAAISGRDTRMIIPVVIVLIAALLLAYLRSIVAMIYLIATVVLSYGAALGLGWLIIHDGLGADAIQGFIPLYAFVFLVALGEDYNIFMVSSIWQKSRHMPLRQAIREGVAQTGSVITSAGLILAGTFAVLATLPIQVLVHFGIVTAIGVLLDTFVVRPFLVPAITVLLGRRAFWPGQAGMHAELEPGAGAYKDVNS